MKKFISLIIASAVSVFVLTPSLRARDLNESIRQKREVLAQNTNQVYVAVHDFLPISGLVTLFGSIFGSSIQAIAGSEYIFAGALAPGGYELGYERVVGSWAFGGQAAYTPFLSYQRHRDTGAISVSGKVDYLSACATAKYYYSAKPKFRFYCSFIAGAIVPVGSEDMNVIPAIQVNPLCIRFGGQKVAGFAELGLGDLGLTRFGLEYSF